MKERENVVHGLDEFLMNEMNQSFKLILSRVIIGYMFYKKFGAPEDRHEWRELKRSAHNFGRHLI
jgi:hypothetical protein